MWSRPVSCGSRARRGILTCEIELGLVVRGVVGLVHQPLHQRVAVELEELVHVLGLLDAHDVGDALGDLFLARVGELVEDLVVKGLQLDHLLAEQLLAVDAEVLEGLGGGAEDLLRAALERRHDVLELGLEEVGMRRRPLGIAAKDHDGREPELLVADGDLDQEGEDLRQDAAVVGLDHAAHGPHREEGGLERLPVGHRGLRRLAAVLVLPDLDGVVHLGEAGGDAHDLAGVLERVAHVVAELAELLLLLPVAVEEVDLVGVVRVGVLELLEQDVDELRENVDELQPRLDVVVQRQVLLELVPEREGVADHVPVLVPRAALEQAVDQGAEVLRLAGDDQDPRLAGLGEHARDGLEPLGVVVARQGLDARPKLEHPREEGLDRLEVVVHVLGLPADDAQAVGRRGQRLVLGHPVHDGVHERRADDDVDRDLAEPRADAVKELGVGCGSSCEPSAPAAAAFRGYSREDWA